MERNAKCCRPRMPANYKNTSSALTKEPVPERSGELMARDKY
jgi:hypothetical protein